MITTADRAVIIALIKALGGKGGGGGGTSDYSQLNNKPQINGVTLDGNKTDVELGITGAIEKILLNGVEQPITDKTVALTVMTNTVNDLVNYYRKSETYTQDEVNSLIGAITTLDIQVVNTLPTEDISRTTIYLVPRQDPEAGNIKDEYINLDGTSQGWELIGSTEIDLTGYVTTDQLNQALADYVTEDALETILEDYVTTEALNTALEGKLNDFTATVYDSDVDSLKSTGVYYCNGATNAPATRGVLYVGSSGGTYPTVTQMFVASKSDGAGIYFRALYGNDGTEEWTQWEEIATKSMVSDFVTYEYLTDSFEFYASATNHHDVGDVFYWLSASPSTYRLCIATEEIDVDDTIELDTNVRQVTIAEIIDEKISQIDLTSKVNYTNIGTVETQLVASKRYTADSLLVYDGNIYKVISTIAKGAAIVIGTNVKQATISDIVSSKVNVSDYNDLVKELVHGVGNFGTQLAHYKGEVSDISILPTVVELNDDNYIGSIYTVTLPFVTDWRFWRFDQDVAMTDIQMPAYTSIMIIGTRELTADTYAYVYTCISTGSNAVNLGDIAYVNDNRTADGDFEKGQLLVYKRGLYVAKSQITLGDLLIEDDNIQKVTLNDYLLAMKYDIEHMSEEIEELPEVAKTGDYNDLENKPGWVMDGENIVYNLN